MSDFGRCDVQLDKTKTERKSQDHFEKGPTNSRLKIDDVMPDVECIWWQWLAATVTIEIWLEKVALEAE